MDEDFVLGILGSDYRFEINVGLERIRNKCLKIRREFRPKHTDLRFVCIDEEGCLEAN